MLASRAPFSTTRERRRKLRSVSALRDSLMRRMSVGRDLRLDVERIDVLADQGENHLPIGNAPTLACQLPQPADGVTRENFRGHAIGKTVGESIVRPVASMIARASVGQSRRPEMGSRRRNRIRPGGRPRLSAAPRARPAWTTSHARPMRTPDTVSWARERRRTVSSTSGNERAKASTLWNEDCPSIRGRRPGGQRPIPLMTAVFFMCLDYTIDRIVRSSRNSRAAPCHAATRSQNCWHCH